jgi:amidase
MTMGLSSSLDDAVRKAKTDMVDWLLSEYQLTLPEVSQVVGTSAEYRVSVVLGGNSGIVLKLPKDRLRALTRRAKAGIIGNE